MTKRVFNLETGELLPKTEYEARVKRVKKEATNQKRRQKYKVKKHYEKKAKELNDEYEDFMRNIENLPKPKIRPKSIEPRSKEINNVNGDTQYHYQFDFDYSGYGILEFINSDIEDMMDVIEDNLEACFAMKSIKEILDRDTSYISVQLVMRNVAYNQNETKYISINPRPLRPKDDLYEELTKRVVQYFEKYNEDCLVIDGIKLWIIDRNPVNGRGSTARSIQTSNKLWKDVSIKTKYNCLYCAVGIHNKHKYKEYLEEPSKLINIGKQLKFKVKKHFEICPKRKYSTDYEIKLCADYLHQRIILYNNQYRKIEEFVPEGLDTKKDTIEIRINNNHYSTLIRRKDIGEEDEPPVIFTEYIEDTREKHLKLYENGVFNDEEDEIIQAPRKFKTEFNKKYAATISYDIEATPDPNDHNYHKAYAVGFCYYTEKEVKNIQFWGMDCQEMFLDYLLKNIEELDKYTIYAHNGGKYDYPNLFREALLRYERLVVQKVIELNGRIISFKITNGQHEIYFRDSWCILNGSLEDLTKEFKVKHKKLKELVKHDDINLDNYITHKPEIQKYLTHDCLGLLEVVQSFSRAVWDSTGINLSQIFTAATLGKKYFYKKYYNQFQSPIYFLTKAKDEFIRKTYFGGRNEVFKLKEIKGPIYYYDFTSLYPSVGCKYLPFGEPEWLVLKNMKDFKQFFGFCDVWARTKDFSKKPLHPVLMDTGKRGTKRLFFPHLKNWTKLRLFSQEIREGINNDLYDYKFENDGDTCFGIRFCSWT